MIAVVAEKFKDDYLRKLAIMDHLHELLYIYQTEVKAMSIDDNFEKELADLYILLQIHFSNDHTYVVNRMKQFEEKIIEAQIKESTRRDK